MSFLVAYEARIQVDRLTGAEKADLARLFDDPQPPAKRTSEDHFVSNLGSKLVLWRRVGAQRTAEVLSVLDKAYAA